jgi:hypothetical protein
VRGVAASAIVAEMLDLEAFRDGPDPQLVCGSMGHTSVVQCLDTPVTVYSMAQPDPAPVLLFLDFTEEAFLKACHARAGVQVIWVAAC